MSFKMKIGVTLQHFNELLETIPWPDRYESSFLGIDLSTKVLESQLEDTSIAITAADASQRKIGVGLLKFSLLRAIYVDDSVNPEEVNLSILLVPPPSVFWGKSKKEASVAKVKFLRDQIKTAFEDTPNLSFMNENWVESTELEHFSSRDLRTVLEFSSQLKALKKYESVSRILFIDGYLMFGFFKHLEGLGTKIGTIKFCDEMVSKNVYPCGIIKEGYVLDRAYYEIQRRLKAKGEFQELHLYKLSSKDDALSKNGEVSEIYQTSSGVDIDFDDDDSEALSLEEMLKEETPLHKCFDYYIVSLKAGETLPFIVQLYRGIPPEQQYKILKNIINSSQMSHPLLGYPNLLNEAHNRSYISLSETDLLEKQLNLKLQEMGLSDDEIDMKYELVRANRNKNR